MPKRCLDCWPRLSIVSRSGVSLGRFDGRDLKRKLFGAEQGRR